MSKKQSMDMQLSPIMGRIWQDQKKKSWHAEIPYLDIKMKAESKLVLLETIQNSVELLSADPGFMVEVIEVKNYICLKANDLEELMSLKDAVPFFLNPAAMLSYSRPYFNEIASR